MLRWKPVETSGLLMPIPRPSSMPTTGMSRNSTMKLYALPVDTFMLLHGYGNYQYRRDFIPSPDTLLRQWTVRLATPRNASQLTSLSMVDAEGEQLSARHILP